MIKLNEEVGTHWTTEYTFNPYLIEYVHGDGLQVICLGYMEDRPKYYVLRIDSSVDIDGDDFPCVLGEIESEIYAESEEFMTDTQRDQMSYQGWFTDGDREWPIPPFEESCGSSWDTWEPNDGECYDWYSEILKRRPAKRQTGDV